MSELPYRFSPDWSVERKDDKDDEDAPSRSQKRRTAESGDSTEAAKQRIRPERLGFFGARAVVEDRGSRPETVTERAETRSPRPEKAATTPVDDRAAETNELWPNPANIPRGALNLGEAIDIPLHEGERTVITLAERLHEPADRPAAERPEPAPDGGGGGLPPEVPPSPDVRHGGDELPPLPPAGGETGAATAPSAPAESYRTTPDRVLASPESARPTGRSDSDPERRVSYMHAAPLTPNLLRANSRTNEQWVSRRDHNRAVRRANEEGKGNGLAVGLLFAMYEHFKHRRNEKRLTKEVAQGVKKQQRSEENARFAANEHARQETLTQAELRRTQQQVERLAAEKASPKLEQVQPAEGQLKAPEGFELRLDGAYLTQVRKGTGEAVDPTAFQRGHEIHSELRKEKTPAAQRNAAAGEVALVAAAMSSRGSTPGGGSGAGTVGTSGSPAGVPPIPAGIPTARTQGLPPSRNGMTQPTDDQSTSSQPIWPWLVALAVVAVCLAFVLH